MRFRTGATALNCVPVRRRWKWLGSLGALSSKRKFLSLGSSEVEPRRRRDEDPEGIGRKVLCSAPARNYCKGNSRCPK